MNIYGIEIDHFDIVVFVIIIIAIYLLWYYLISDSNNVLILDHSQDATVFTKYTQTSTVTYDFAFSGWVNIESWDDTISPNLFTICNSNSTTLTTSNYKFVDSMNRGVTTTLTNIITYSPATYTLTSTVFIISSSGKYQLRSATKNSNTYLFLSDNYGVSNWDLVTTPIPMLTTQANTSLKCAMSDDSKYITIIYTDAAAAVPTSYCWSLNSNSILTPPVKKISATTEQFIDISMSSDGKYQTVITKRNTTGTITTTDTSITITGINTQFTSTLEVGDVIFTNVTNGSAIIGTIATIGDIGSATLVSVAAIAISSTSYQTSGRIYISDDYGSTWTKINKKTEIWKNVYVSSNGKCQVATTNSSAAPFNIYVSQNYGLDTSWNLVRDIIEAPISFAMSSDGAYQYVLTVLTSGGNTSGNIYSSTESGVDGSWIKKAANKLVNSSSIATSSNGQTVVISSGAVSTTTQSILYMSFDYGNTFIYDSSFGFVSTSSTSSVPIANNIRLTGSGNDIYYTDANTTSVTYKISNGGGDSSSRSVDCTPYIGVTLDNSCKLILTESGSAFAPIARIPTQRWVHILININGDNTIVPTVDANKTQYNPIDIYINGDLVSTKFASTVLSLSDDHDYYVGGGTTTSSKKVSDVTTSGYAGKIRDVKITLKSCTPQEVYDMYKKGISKSFFEDLLSYKLKFSLLTDNKESSSATI